MGWSMDSVREIYRGAKFFGTRFQCPWCGGHFRTFLPFGVKPVLPNVLCPRCGSLARHRLLWFFLKERTDFFSAKLKVLHIAPEARIQKVFKSMPNLDYISADLESPLAMVKLDVCDIQFADNLFDVIFCSHVLEHIPEDHKAMCELYRVLKPGGWAILQSPLDLSREQTFEDFTVVSPQERERLFNQRDHVRVYGRDYKDRLERAGWRVKIDEFFRGLDPQRVRKFGLNMEEMEEGIYYCTKPRREDTQGRGT